MTPHTHQEIVPGCYRCELGRDEAESAEREMVQDAIAVLVSRGIDTMEKFDALMAAFHEREAAS